MFHLYRVGEVIKIDKVRFILIINMITITQ